MRTRTALGALLLVAAAAAAVASRPAAWRVARGASLAAAPAEVRAALVEPQRWAAWSPWAALAPGAQWTSGGPPSGRGATAYWSVDGSPWRLTVVSAGDDAVGVELEREGPAPFAYDLAFTLSAEGAGTRVGWVARGEDDLLGKARALLWSHERELGPVLELGLARLGAAAGAAGQPFRVERAAHLTASPAAVLEALTDLRQWRGWSPAGAGQPGAAWSFGGPAVGAGASAYWVDTGTGDRGRLTIVRDAAGRVDVEQELEGSRPSSWDHAITVAAEGAGARVTWVVTGTRQATAAADRGAGLPEEALGPEVEAALAGLRHAVEGAAGPWNGQAPGRAYDRGPRSPP